MDHPAIDAYLAGLPDPHRELLTRVRSTVLDVCPDAVEAIAYGMPAFRLQDRLLLSYAGYRRHCAIYPASGMVMETLGDELAPFVTHKATMRITPAHPLPDDVLRRYIAIRVREIEAATRG
jgi:uncharacterized protein YdhG (YjbR/CyaY superfamily)